MMVTRSKFVDQMLAAALLIAALFAFYAVVVAPLAQSMQTTHDRIAEQRTLLGRLRADIDRTAASGTPADDTTAARADVYLPGSSTATRVANLQARLGTLVAGSNVAILSARATIPEARDGLSFVGVEISFRATDAQLESVLTAIERDRPFLFVDGLQMTPSPDQNNEDGATYSQNDVTLRIAGAVEPVQG